MFTLAIAAGHSLAERWLVPAAILSLVIVFGLPLLAMEFVFGMLIARAFLSGRAMVNPAVTFWAGGLLLLAPLFIDIPADRMIVSGIPAALLEHGAVFLPQISNRTFEFLGDASYSIYLLQVISIPGALQLAQAATPGMPGDAVVLWIMMASLAVGAANYVGFERPWLVYMRRKWPR